MKPDVMPDLNLDLKPNLTIDMSSRAITLRVQQAEQLRRVCPALAASARRKFRPVCITGGSDNGSV